jgi:hypothetical protein
LLENSIHLLGFRAEPTGASLEVGLGGLGSLPPGTVFVAAAVAVLERVALGDAGVVGDCFFAIL